MKRLVAFGCSSVLGQGLPDVFDPKFPDRTNPNLPSIYSWPSVLAKLFNVDCVHKAIPGSSNKKILHDIVNFEPVEGDKYFVLWTIPVRHSILKNPNWSINMQPSQERYENYYLEYYDDYDQIFLDTLYKNYAKILLESRNIPFEFLYFQEDHNVIHQTVPVYWTKHYVADDVCEDGLHASVGAHENYAKEIYKCLTE